MIFRLICPFAIEIAIGIFAGYCCCYFICMKAARDAWIAGKGKTKIPVEAYGWKWETTGMASTTAEQLHPDWEIKSGGATGLPYLDIIKRMKGEHDEHRHDKRPRSK